MIVRAKTMRAHFGLSSWLTVLANHRFDRGGQPLVQASRLTKLLGPIILGILLAQLLALTGCSGRKGPPRYHLSGSVTHGGKPVPAGSITFIPDTSQGNKGPAGSVPIKDGKYSTRQVGEGHIGGPHVVRITGLSGVASDEFSEGEPIFPDYQTKADLPKQTATQNFEVPANWVFPPRRPVVPRGP